MASDGPEHLHEVADAAPRTAQEDGREADQQAPRSDQAQQKHHDEGPGGDADAKRRQRERSSRITKLHAKQREEEERRAREELEEERRAEEKRFARMKRKQERLQQSGDDR